MIKMVRKLMRKNKTGSEKTTRIVAPRAKLASGKRVKSLRSKLEGPLKASLFTTSAHEIFIYTNYPGNVIDVKLFSQIFSAALTYTNYTSLKGQLFRLLKACEGDRRVGRDVLNSLNQLRYYPKLFTIALGDLSEVSSEGTSNLSKKANSWILGMNVASMMAFGVKKGNLVEKDSPTEEEIQKIYDEFSEFGKK